MLTQNNGVMIPQSDTDRGMASGGFRMCKVAKLHSARLGISAACLAVLAGLACAHTDEQVGGEALPWPAEKEIRFQLCGMYAHGSTEAGPSRQHAGAERFFWQGMELHEKGQYSDAAQQFMAAAGQLLLSSGGTSSTSANSFAVNRRIAYANAVLSWLNAGVPDAAREALLDVAARDKMLAADLTRVARRLPAPCSCDLHRL